jgi:SAM-dependent methyltransferase
LPGTGQAATDRSKHGGRHKVTKTRPAADDPVASQYENWAYPQPIEDLDEWSKTFVDSGDPTVVHYVYWPDREYWDGMKILIAGCGTNEAASIAYRNPKASVVGIDVSQASLNHEKYLQEKHGLANLTLHQMNIEDAASLDGRFDLIVSTGVLHHLEDPAAGLSALSTLLEPEGVIEMMLYGKYGRTGIYMMQDIFQRLGLGQSAEDVETVKSTLRSLPANHFARSYIRTSTDLVTDTGIVDTFLHRRDRAYSVRDCLNLVAECGLVFQTWLDNGQYYPDAGVHPHNPIFSRIMSLPAPDIWEVMELFYGLLFTHVFVACRPDRPEQTYRLDLDGDAFWNYVPVRWISKFTQGDPAKNEKPTIERPPVRPMPLDGAQVSLFRQLDGQNTVRQAMEKSGLAAEGDRLEIFTRNFIKSLWRLGFVQIRI